MASAVEWVKGSQLRPKRTHDGQVNWPEVQLPTRPPFARVPEWPKGTACKAVQSPVQIRPRALKPLMNLDQYTWVLEHVGPDGHAVLTGPFTSSGAADLWAAMALDPDKFAQATPRLVITTEMRANEYATTDHA